MKRALSIPVVANGGLWTIGDIRACLEETECDAAMIGAGAMRDPGLAERWRDSLAGARDPRPSPRRDRLAFAHIYARAAGGPAVFGFLEYFVLRSRVLAFRIRRRGRRPRGEGHAGR